MALDEAAGIAVAVWELGGADEAAIGGAWCYLVAPDAWESEQLKTSLEAATGTVGDADSPELTGHFPCVGLRDLDGTPVMYLWWMEQASAGEAIRLLYNTLVFG